MLVLFTIAVHVGAVELSSPAFGLTGPSPGPDVYADEVLQQAIDRVAKAGGGVASSVRAISNCRARLVTKPW